MFPTKTTCHVTIVVRGVARFLATVPRGGPYKKNEYGKSRFNQYLLSAYNFVLSTAIIIIEGKSYFYISHIILPLSVKEL